MSSRPSTARKSVKASPTPKKAHLERHEQFMQTQQAKGLLHPEEEWEERVNQGLRALFGPAPTRRLS